MALQLTLKHIGRYYRRSVDFKILCNGSRGRWKKKVRKTKRSGVYNKEITLEMLRYQGTVDTHVHYSRGQLLALRKSSQEKVEHTMHAGKPAHVLFCRWDLPELAEIVVGVCLRESGGRRRAENRSGRGDDDP